MSINLHNLKSPKKKKKKKRVGRGDGSGHGTYSCRGQKGQRSRSGGKRGLRLKALRKVWKKIPKKGGFKSLQKKMTIVNLEFLEKTFSEKDTITPRLLFERNIVKDKKAKIKILGQKINKKMQISAHAFSKLAEAAIKKAGGKVNLIK